MVGHRPSSPLDLLPQGASSRRAVLLNVLERNGASGMVRADRAAEKAVPVEDPDFGHVAGIVTDGDMLADKRRQRGVHVAQALEVDAIPTHEPGLGNGEQQQIESPDTLGQVWKPTIAPPGGIGGRADLAMAAGVMCTD